MVIIPTISISLLFLLLVFHWIWNFWYETKWETLQFENHTRYTSTRIRHNQNGVTRIQFSFKLELKYWLLFVKMLEWNMKSTLWIFDSISMKDGWSFFFLNKSLLSNTFCLIEVKFYLFKLINVKFIFCDRKKWRRKKYTNCEKKGCSSLIPLIRSL